MAVIAAGSSQSALEVALLAGAAAGRAITGGGGATAGPIAGAAAAAAGTALDADFAGAASAAEWLAGAATVLVA